MGSVIELSYGGPYPYAYLLVYLGITQHPFYLFHFYSHLNIESSGRATGSGAEMSPHFRFKTEFKTFSDRCDHPRRFSPSTWHTSNFCTRTIILAVDTNEGFLVILCSASLEGIRTILSLVVFPWRRLTYHTSTSLYFLNQQHLTAFLVPYPCSRCVLCTNCVLHQPVPFPYPP